MPRREIDVTDGADGTEPETEAETAGDAGSGGRSSTGTDATRESGRDADTDTRRYHGERVCPECDAPRVVRDGGCPTCRACGWSKCAFSPL